MLAVRFAAVELETTPAQQSTTRQQSVAERPKPRLHDQAHLILETRGRAHRTPRLRMAAGQRKVVVAAVGIRVAAAVDIKVAASTGRS
jgi:hypothetical protein